MPNRWIQRWGYQEIMGKSCSITMEPRPPYCDRGNFLCKLDVKSPYSLHIDDDDLWPRYYMDEGRAKLEVEDWLKKRGEWLETKESAE